MSDDPTPTIGDVLLACKQARAAAHDANRAADAILAHSSLWLTLHPLHTRRLRRACIAARDRMLAKRDVMVRTAEAYHAVQAANR